MTKPPSNRDVIIIGAGPAGSAAAIELAKSGLDVLLIDGKKFPRRKACGGCLNKVSVGFMEKLLPKSTVRDVWNESIPLKKFLLFQNSQSIPLEMDEGGFAVDRAQMDFALVKHAQNLGVDFLSPAKAKLASCEPDLCHIEVVSNGSKQTLSSKIVVIACGLGNQAAGPYEQFQQTPARNSRLGVEALFDAFPSDYLSGSLCMAIGKHGYVGLTHIGNKRLHVAAAVDRSYLQELGPHAAVKKIMRRAGAPLLTQSNVTWRGTPPLTAGVSLLADNRVFVIGDAAGYVEPFTGEGIRWALENGIGVAPFVISGVDRWHSKIADDYRQWYRRTIRSRQKLCRRLSLGLKRPSIRWAAHQALRLRPALAHSIIKRLNS